MLRNCLALTLACATNLSAQSPTGQATAGWLAASSHCPPGRTLETAVRLTLNPGWHTYWIHPGEGGMPLEFQWQLPDGWQAGGISYPAPQRFKTGTLHNFGYEGTVVLPATLTAPAGFSGSARLGLHISWLACDDEACVPGEASLQLTVTAGPHVPSEHATTINQAKKTIPQPWNDRAKLSVSPDGKNLELTIEPVTPGQDDWNRFEVFPATQRTLDPRSPVRFARDGRVWRARAPLDEYAAPPIRELRLVFTAGPDAPPRVLDWTDQGAGTTR